MSDYVPHITAGISIVINIVSLVVILFLIPKSSKIEKIFEIVHNLENRMLTTTEIDERIDLKIFKHMEKCKAHKEHNASCVHKETDE